MPDDGSPQAGEPACVESFPRAEVFLRAQDTGGTYERALRELRSGRKRTHWMWFIFPQVEGLGRSETSRRFALSSVAEAAAYLRHPVLGPRLLECSRAVLSHASERAAEVPASAEEIFGSIDALKLRSSMTLFREAAPDIPEFGEVLDRFFGGEPDPATLSILADPSGPC